MAKIVGQVLHSKNNFNWSKIVPNMNTYYEWSI